MSDPTIANPDEPKVWWKSLTVVGVLVYAVNGYLKKKGLPAIDENTLTNIIGYLAQYGGDILAVALIALGIRRSANGTGGQPIAKKLL